MTSGLVNTDLWPTFSVLNEEVNFRVYVTFDLNKLDLWPTFSVQDEEVNFRVSENEKNLNASAVATLASKYSIFDGSLTLSVPYFPVNIGTWCIYAPVALRGLISYAGKSTWGCLTMYHSFGQGLILTLFLAVTEIAVWQMLEPVIALWLF